MTQKITVDVAENVHQWLDSIAQSLGISIEEAAAKELAAACSRAAQLSWQEQDVLDILKGDMNGRPGQKIQIKSIWLHWGTRGTSEEMVDALNSLEVKGLVVNHSGNPAFVQTELTLAGYEYS